MGEVSDFGQHTWDGVRQDTASEELKGLLVSSNHLLKGNNLVFRHLPWSRICCCISWDVCPVFKLEIFSHLTTGSLDRAELYCMRQTEVHSANIVLNRNPMTVSDCSDLIALRCVHYYSTPLLPYKDY